MPQTPGSGEACPGEDIGCIWSAEGTSHRAFQARGKSCFFNSGYYAKRLEVLSDGVRSFDMCFQKNCSGCWVKNKLLGVEDEEDHQRPVIWTRDNGDCLQGQGGVS